LKTKLVHLDIATIQKAYRRYAHLYNFYFGWIFHPGRQTAVELCNLKPGSKVLEVGVGTGLSLKLYPKSVKVTGIDISPEMLAYAKKLVADENLENIEALEVMDAEHTKFADNTFDSVVAMYVATVVPNPKDFVAEMQRVCKPGGHIILLNHFNDQTTMFGLGAGLLAPLSKYMGFRPNLTLEEFIRITDVKIRNKISVNVFSLWTILVVKNEK
jgi:phosphatidylethanolamine/phosphatidyl-N-methylethanolamine N-methyltransferase